jgi:hypothetical protein
LVCIKNIHDRAYLSIDVTSGLGAGAMQGAWTGVFRGIRLRLCRILDMNFGENIFHALGWIGWRNCGLPKNISSPIHLGCLHYEGGRGTSWGHTQMTQPTITGTEPILVEVLVGDPLSEVTRKTRLYLLAVSLIGVAMVTTGLVPTKIATFGIELEQPNRSALLFLIALVNLYFLAAFIIYAVSDYMKRVAQVDAARERRYSALRFQLELES